VRVDVWLYYVFGFIAGFIGLSLDLWLWAGFWLSLSSVNRIVVWLFVEERVVGFSGINAWCRSFVWCSC